jgi:hypothetical protein
VRAIVDRLFDGWSDQEGPLLKELADIELQLERHRRVRRALLAGAALASVLCFVSARFSIPTLAWISGLFVFCALSAANLLLWERAFHRRRRRLLDRLPASTRLRIESER